jgi:hypothetical protein
MLCCMTYPGRARVKMVEFFTPKVAEDGNLPGDQILPTLCPPYEDCKEGKKYFLSASATIDPLNIFRPNNAEPAKSSNR